MTAREQKPETSEHLPYYGRYIALVPAGDVITTLEAQMRDSQALLAEIPPDVATYRYAPDKWSLNEMVGHVIDTERIMSVRALRFARADASPLPGFEQDDYVRGASFDAYPLADLAAELEAVRRSTLFLFRHLREEAWMRRGTANNAEVTVRALAYIIAGHELHHREILRTRYL
ncbi:MAG TPA: DinB family protein [Gemmatimonadaceae bacterium]|nr:DinB family protein [Gemmatimonadaceae bacterium]